MALNRSTDLHAHLSASVLVPRGRRGRIFALSDSLRGGALVTLAASFTSFVACASEDSQKAAVTSDASVHQDAPTPWLGPLSVAECRGCAVKNCFREMAAG